MIQSVEDFRNNLREIDLLLSYARAKEKDITEYKLFNKVAIVLLCSHFEVLVESFIAEHAENIKLSYNTLTLPQYMKDNYINDTVKSLKDHPTPSKKKKPLKALFQLHSKDAVPVSSLSDLVLDMKFSFGKHGQEQVEKLLTKFGLGQFVTSPEFKRAFRDINSAIAIRHNIIHEGNTPSLTHIDIENYKNTLLTFASALEDHMFANQHIYYGRNVY